MPNASTTTPAPACGIGEIELAFGGGATQQEAQRRADHAIGKARERFGDRDDIPDAADIGERDEKRHLLLGETQGMHQVGIRVRCVTIGTQGREIALEARFRCRANEPPETNRIGDRKAPEIGRMIGDAREEIGRRPPAQESFEFRRMGAGGGGEIGEPRPRRLCIGEARSTADPLPEHLH